MRTGQALGAAVRAWASRGQRRNPELLAGLGPAPMPSGSEGLALTIPSDGFATDAEHVVIATGEIDVSTAAQFWEALAELIEQGQREVVIDMSGVEFIDSQGIAVIVRAHKQVEPYGGNVVIRSPRAQVRTVLEITGLVELLQVEADPG